MANLVKELASIYYGEEGIGIIMLSDGEEIRVMRHGSLNQFCILIAYAVAGMCRENTGVSVEKSAMHAVKTIAKILGEALEQD